MGRLPENSSPSPVRQESPRGSVEAEPARPGIRALGHKGKTRAFLGLVIWQPAVFQFFVRWLSKWVGCSGRATTNGGGVLRHLHDLVLEVEVAMS